MKKENGITLVSLVITIIILIILAGVAINMAIGENGIFNKAQEAKKMQAIGAAKEQIGLEILEAQIEAMEKNEELEQSQVEAIVSKYGTLQADGDTIILNDTEYEVSLREIYNEMAEEEGDETTELAQLKALLAQTTVTEDKMLKPYKAYKDGQLITGTMENYSGQTKVATTIVEDGTNANITIPEAGYYSADSKIQVPIETIKQNVNSLSGSTPLIDLICVSVYVGSGGDGGGKYTYVIDEDCKYFTVTNYGTSVNCAKQWSWNSDTTSHTVKFYGSDGSTLISTVTPDIGVKTQVPTNAKYAVIEMGSWNGSGGRNNYISLNGSIS